MNITISEIRIRKRTVTEWLVAIVFFLPFVQGLLSEFIGFPDEIKFFADVAVIFLLMKIALSSKDIQMNKSFIPFLWVIGLFFAYVTVIYFLNYQSVFYFLWGIRNYFRFYIAFIAYVVFVGWQDVKKWLNILDGLYIINFFVIIFQFSVGYRQDFLGGIFGVQKGCNGGLLIFITLIITRTVLLFMRNEGSTIKCLIFSFIGLLVAALAELKFFFVIFICVVLITAVITKSSFKKTGFFLFSVMLIFVFSSILSLMYDDFERFLSFDNLFNSIFNPNYATKEDIGRFTAIPIISNKFLTNLPDRLFGMGLGNADSSSIDLFNTPFFDMYGAIHYSIFLYSFLYLETGIVGLLIYTSFFIVSFVVSLRLFITKKADEYICQLSMIFSIVCIAFMFYNISLRNEMSAYLAFFVLSLPLISSGSVQLKSNVKI